MTLKLDTALLSHTHTHTHAHTHTHTHKKKENCLKINKVKKG